MSEAHEPGLIQRVRHTPLRDVLRLQITGRLDWRGRIASSGLDAAVQSLLVRLVKRTRLWRREKAEIADELIHHFEDATAGGQSAAQAIDQFGDWRNAARLIRRATRRKRPLWWQAWRGAFWLGVWMVAFYGALWLYLISGDRQIKTDYVAVLNEQAAAVPEADRGWPIFRDAMLPILRDPAYQQLDGAARSGLAYREEDPATWPVKFLIHEQVRPGHGQWPRVAAFIERHRTSIQGFREAAAKPGFGFLTGSKYAVEDLPLFAPEDDPQLYAKLLEQEKSDEPEMVMGAIVSHAHFTRMASLLLVSDARLALERGDGERFSNDAIAILRLADHIDEQPTLLNQYLAMAHARLALELISETLATHPDRLSDAQLVELAHAIAARRTYTIDYTGERVQLYDLLQRIYTDDGSGDGHLDAAGYHMYKTQIADEGASSCDRGAGPSYRAWRDAWRDVSREPLSVTGYPLVSLIAPGRQAMKRQIDRLFALFQADASVPMHQQPVSRGAAAVEALLSDSAMAGVKYDLIESMMARYGPERKDAEAYTAEMDGALTAIALELYRRDHAGYPGSLQALVPHYLPDVPIDRITGDPLNYRLVDGRPVLYSVGADRDDDGGPRPSVEADPTRANLAAVRWVIPEDQTAVDGDWVVWPLHEQTTGDTDD